MTAQPFHGKESNMNRLTLEQGKILKLQANNMNRLTLDQGFILKWLQLSGHWGGIAQKEKCLKRLIRNMTTTID